MAYAYQKQVLRKTYGRKCMLCRRLLKDRDITFHHIKPKSCGGEATVENGAILCPECQTIIHEFEYGNEGYSILTERIKKNMRKNKRTKK